MNKLILLIGLGSLLLTTYILHSQDRSQLSSPEEN